MNYFKPLSTLEPGGTARWKRYINDSFLALGSILFLTGVIFLFHLYPHIPDSILVYLLAILALAGTRGLFASLFASAIAFFAFDFLFVAPIYSLIVAKFADILALIIFMITAIITSQLASALRERAEQANRRERETRILYDFVRTTNREEDIERQLHIFTQAIVEIFSSWGIRDCILLLPNAEGVLSPRTSVLQPIDQLTFSSNEKTMLAFVLQHAHTMDFHPDSLPDQLSPDRTQAEKPCLRCYTRLIPLKADQKVIGVLRLLIEDNLQANVALDSLGQEQAQSTPQAVFFSAFLEQAIAVIERERLQHESLHLKVLQQIDALRAALLSSISHDLRTPLTIIKAKANSLWQEECSEEVQHSFVSTIEHETDRLNNFVEKILDISRIEAGTLSLDKVWYPLDELVLDVLDLMSTQLQARKVSVYQPADLPPVELDAVYIHQVLTNLIENAVHYTPAETPIDISVQMEGAWIQVSVADQGPGIPSSEREQIFDKFYRVLEGRHISEKSKGLGFGLAVCRGFIEAHGGQIWAETRLGGGAIFRFTLPLSNREEMEL